jgi:hypothetical protein
MRLAILAWVGVMAGCSQPVAVESENGALDQRLLAVAGEYLKYGRVDDLNRWSPELCSLKPSRGRMSASEDSTTHGRKIYYVFARDRDAYVSGIRSSQPVGQVVVKEAWEPVPAQPPAHSLDDLAGDEGGSYVPRAELDGKTFKTGARSGLFIMLKEETGWRYGTVSADGARVVQSGDVRSCIGCHRDAKPDSLFGLSARPGEARSAPHRARSSD